jgi:hypothetical protein
MAPPVLDATIGGADSNSYVTLEWANEFADSASWGVEWNQMTDDEKTIYLVSATRSLQYLDWYGDRCDCTPDQALAHPVKNYCCRGTKATCDIIPVPIMESTVYLAYAMYASPLTTIDFMETTGPVKRQKLGDLEQEFFQAGEKVGTSAPLVLQRFPWLVDTLGCWLATRVGNAALLSRC